MAHAYEAARDLDVSIPNAARMYDYFLGGKDNFEADRVTAEKVLALVPKLRQSVVENRRFIGRVVRFLAAEAGIDQFLDIGAGLPTRDPVHQVAQKINPCARVVYADYDPVVVTHGSALLAVPDRSVMVRADLRRPEELLAHPQVRGFLDLSRPVAVMLIAIMHFVPDSDDPYGRGSAADAVRWSMNLGFDVRERGVAWLDGVYLGLCVRAGQRVSGVSW